MSKVLIIVGIVFVLTGFFIRYGGKIPFLGKLPGDILIEKGNVKIYIPITSCILVSLLVSFLLYIYFRIRK